METAQKNIIFHPGRLLRESVRSLELTQRQLVLGTQIPLSSVNKILKGRKPINAIHSLRLARFLNYPDSYWLQQQCNYDLSIARLRDSDTLARIQPVRLE